MADRQPASSGKPHLAIHLLGAFFVSVDQIPIPEMQWRSRRAKGLVKLLALAPGHRLHREQVIDALWPGSASEPAYNNFHNALFTTRQILDKVLPGCLVLEEGFLNLTHGEGQAVAVDVEDFETAARQAKESKSIAAYQTALGLYTGDLLPDDRYEAWTLQPREALRQTYLGLLLSLGQLQENAGDYPEGMATLQRLLAVDPTHEEAHRGLMRLYARSGQRQQALRQFQVLSTALQSELEVQPGQETFQLYEVIQSGQFAATLEKPSPPGPTVTEAAPVQEPKPRHNLPYRLSTFIGREVEIDQVTMLLRSTRLLTITGEGGIGKTSLALQAAGHLIEVDVFPDGVWLVELAPLSEPELVPLACTQALGLIEQSTTPDLTKLTRYLQKKHLLLILDSCEHLISACSELVAELLRICPSLTILVTSRELLNLDGERIYRLPSMAAPGTGQRLSGDQMIHYDAVRLFVERARQASPDFSLNQDNAAMVALICQRLDGIPLAIELAAARMRSLAVEQIAQRLEHAFHLLSGGSRKALPRQQTLKASIDWSYDLLMLEERLLLSRLSVFAGGWTLEAAEEVCVIEENAVNEPAIQEGMILDLLARLVDKSLVQARVSGRETRYSMLEVIRQYAQAKLVETGEVQAVRDRHQAYYSRLTARAEPRLRSKHQTEWLERLDDELSNLRLALEWSLERNVDLGLQIMNDSDWFWMIRSLFVEGTRWLQKLLVIEEAQRGNGPLEGNRALQRARGLNQAYLTTFGYTGFYSREQKIQMAAESIRILRSLGPAARHELGLALLHYIWISGHLLDQTPEVKEMLDIFREFNDRKDFSHYTSHKLNEAFHQSDFALAKGFAQETLAMSREIGDLAGIGSALLALADCLVFDGEYTQAETNYQEKLAISRQIDDRHSQYVTYRHLCELYCAQGHYAKAFDYADLAQKWHQGIDNPDEEAKGLLERLITHWAKGDFPMARSLGDEILSKYPENLPELTYAWLAIVNMAEGDLEQAQSRLLRARDEKTANYTLVNKRSLLQSSTWYFLRRGRLAFAARLQGAGEVMYRRFSPALAQGEREEHDRCLVEMRRGLGEDAFMEAWQTGEALTLDQALEEAFDHLEKEGSH